MYRLISIFMLLITCALAACQPAETPAADVVPAIERPTFQPATDEAYDFDSIPVYAGNHADIYA